MFEFGEAGEQAEQHRALPSCGIDAGRLAGQHGELYSEIVEQSCNLHDFAHIAAKAIE